MDLAAGIGGSGAGRRFRADIAGPYDGQALRGRPGQPEHATDPQADRGTPHTVTRYATSNQRT